MSGRRWGLLGVYPWCRMTVGRRGHVGSRVDDGLRRDGREGSLTCFSDVSNNDGVRMAASAQA